MMTFIKNDIVVLALVFFMFALVLTLWLILEVTNGFWATLISCVFLSNIDGWPVGIFRLESDCNIIQTLPLMLILNMAMNIHITVKDFAIKKELVNEINMK